MLCQACEQDDHGNCGMQTWCECDCDGEHSIYIPEDNYFQDDLDGGRLVKKEGAKAMDTYLDGMCATCPDEDAVCMSRIEVNFAIPTLMTQDQQGRLIRLLAEIIDSPWNEPKEGVHWLAGVGSKPNWSQADCAMLGKKPNPNAPASGEPTFDDSVFHVESCARGFVSEKERARALKRRAKQ